MSAKLGPETKAIIEAINKLNKRAHENLNYQIITIDLAVLRDNLLFELPGWFDHLAVGKLTGEATIRLNEATKDAIDLAYLKSVNTPIRRFFITNAEQPGCQLILGIGGETAFISDTTPRATAQPIFVYSNIEETGVGNTFEDDQPETTLPTHEFGVLEVGGVIALEAGRIPIDLKEGILLRVHYILRPTNAVTYQLRVWTAAIDGVATPNLQFAAKLWESPAAQVAATGYDEDVYIPFVLLAQGVFWFSIDWSAAPGNTTGIIQLSGDAKR